jgi:hypothetical protein
MLTCDFSDAKISWIVECERNDSWRNDCDEISWLPVCKLTETGTVVDSMVCPVWYESTRPNIIPLCLRKLTAYVSPDMQLEDTKNRFRFWAKCEEWVSKENIQCDALYAKLTPPRQVLTRFPCRLDPVLEQAISLDTKLNSPNQSDSKDRR